MANLTKNLSSRNPDRAGRERLTCPWNGCPAGRQRRRWWRLFVPIVAVTRHPPSCLSVPVAQLRGVAVVLAVGAWMSHTQF